MFSTKSTYRRLDKKSTPIEEDNIFLRLISTFVSSLRNAFLIRKNRPRTYCKASRPKVLIVERQLLEYRVAFYEKLRILLEYQGIELQLLIGEGTPAEIKKQNQTKLPWTISIPTRYFLADKICWQPFGRYARDADMVIVMHENKLIYNLWLLSFGRPRRLAFWGHGKNMQSNHPNGFKERFKRWTINKVDWWFAYTDSSAALIHAAGFPLKNTTIVDNAVDTNEMSLFCSEVSQHDCDLLRHSFSAEHGKIGLYIGSLYHEKRLDFLLAAAHEIRKKVPDFHLLIVGAGPDQAVIENAAKQFSWIHYAGPLQGRQKALALMVADVMLNPGLVGLGVLDSFVSGKPMFTTDCGLHSPEISYLISGVNGVMTPNNVLLYADEIISVLNDPTMLSTLQSNARATASRYTIENMADRICTGILNCIANYRA